jgi:hypothetical protein
MPGRYGQGRTGFPEPVPVGSGSFLQPGALSRPNREHTRQVGSSPLRIVSVTRQALESLSYPDSPPSCEAAKKSRQRPGVRVPKHRLGWASDIVGGCGRSVRVRKRCRRSPREIAQPEQMPLGPVGHLIGQDLPPQSKTLRRIDSVAVGSPPAWVLENHQCQPFTDRRTAAGPLV